MTNVDRDSDSSHPMWRSYRELLLLRHVESSAKLDHRSAAAIMGVSVKLAHDILTNMTAKGYFHISKLHARRWDYFLSPTGIAEKSRLTFEYLEFSMQFYREARRRSAQLCRDLAESGKRRVALLGAQDLAEIAYLGIQEWELHLTAVYDDTRKKPFMTIPISPVSHLPQDTSAAIIVTLYDAAEPMSPNYLPPSVPRLPSMHWIFPQTVSDAPVHEA